jgi:transcriptional regulator with XRE-family HTH domain
MRVEMTFGEWLKHRRQQLLLTQKELARRVSCSAGTIRKLESNARRPSAQLARLLATHLEVPLQQQSAFIVFARAEAYTAEMATALAAMGEELLRPPPHPLPFTAWPEASPASEVSSIKHNLPPQSTPFIGRSTELAALNTVLARHDWLWLVERGSERPLSILPMAFSSPI